jgi:hypothetical protein
MHVNEMRNFDFYKDKISSKLIEGVGIWPSLSAGFSKT